MYENPTDEQHSAACSVLADRQNVTPSEVLKPTQPLAGPVPSTMVQHHEACCLGAKKQGNTHMLTMLGMQGAQDTGHLPCVKKLPKRLSDMQASPSSPVVMVQKQDETHSQLNKEGSKYLGPTIILLEDQLHTCCSCQGGPIKTEYC